MEEVDSLSTPSNITVTPPNRSTDNLSFALATVIILYVIRYRSSVFLACVSAPQAHCQTDSKPNDNLPFAIVNIFVSSVVGITGVTEV